MRNLTLNIDPYSNNYRYYTTITVLLTDTITHFTPVIIYLLLSQKINGKLIILNIVGYICQMCLSLFGYLFIEGGRNSILYWIQYMVFMIMYIGAGITALKYSHNDLRAPLKPIHSQFQSSILKLEDIPEESIPDDAGKKPPKSLSIEMYDIDKTPSDQKYPTRLIPKVHHIYQYVKNIFLSLVPAVLTIIFLMVCDLTIFNWYVNATDDFISMVIKVVIYPMCCTFLGVICRSCLTVIYNQYNETFYAPVLLITVLYSKYFFSHVLSLKFNNIMYLVISDCLSPLIGLCVKIILRKRDIILNFLVYCQTINHIKEILKHLSYPSNETSKYWQFLNHFLTISVTDQFYQIYTTIDIMVYYSTLLVVISNFVFYYLFNITDFQSNQLPLKVNITIHLCLSLIATIVHMIIDYFVYHISFRFNQFTVFNWLSIAYFVICMVCHCTWRTIWLINPIINYEQ